MQSAWFVSKMVQCVFNKVQQDFIHVTVHLDFVLRNIYAQQV